MLELELQQLGTGRRGGGKPAEVQLQAPAVQSSPVVTVHAVIKEVGMPRACVSIFLSSVSCRLINTGGGSQRYLQVASTVHTLSLSHSPLSPDAGEGRM